MVRKRVPQFVIPAKAHDLLWTLTNHGTRAGIQNRLKSIEIERQDNNVQKGIDQSVTSLSEQNNIRIAVLDSGLGGLSICAELEKGFQVHGSYEQVALLYFNVWPEQNRGYNSLDSVSEQVRVFDCALMGVHGVQPDLIMIACNTLSVIYDQTPFSRNTSIPVIDIVDFGVDLIHANMKEDPSSQTLIIGTRTTISEKAHLRKLVQKGVDPGRLVTQACHGVATEIEKDPQGVAVANLIDTYMDEAAKKLGKIYTVYVALCCTHFAYSKHVFQDKLLDRLPMEIVLLDPNTEMSGFLFKNAHPLLFSTSDIQVKVVSKIQLEQSKIISMSSAVRSTSMKTAAALMDYTYQPDLF